MTICAVKCPECEGAPHHWRPDADRRDDPAEMRYSCVHCPARGIPCPECEGLGTVEDVFADDTGLLLDPECPHCLGWGIVEDLPTPKPKRKSRGDAR